MSISPVFQEHLTLWYFFNYFTAIFIQLKEGESFLFLTLLKIPWENKDIIWFTFATTGLILKAPDELWILAHFLQYTRSIKIFNK